jgi:hypothetical protein
MTLAKTLSLAAAALLMSATLTAAQAGPWQQHHPRRAEVNARLLNQNRRIHADVRNGTLSHAQAHALHRDDHAIRREQRHMSRRNGGYITRPQQRRLNRQENAVSRHIPPR